MTLLQIFSTNQMKPNALFRLARTVHVIASLGMLTLAMAAIPLPAADSTGKPKRPAIYDTKADGEKQVADALATAKREGKNVLLQFGANWCPDCHAMHGLFQSDPQIAAMLKAGYVVALINVDRIDGQQHNAKTIERFGNPITNGIPALIIVNSSGAVLNTNPTDRLKDTDYRFPDKVLAFLKKWTPSAKSKPGTK